MNKAVIRILTVKNEQVKERNGDYMKIIQAEAIPEHNHYFCSRCNNEVVEQFTFCPWCGAMLRVDDVFVDSDIGGIGIKSNNNRYS